MIAHGDCIEVMKTLPENSVDTIYLGVKGYEPYKEGKQIPDSPDKWRRAYQQVKQ